MAEQAGKPRRLGRGLVALLGNPVMVPVIPADTNIVETTNDETTAAGEAREGVKRASAAAARSNVANEPAAVDGLVRIEVGRIEPSRFQPRRVFDEGSIKGLAESIKVSGLMQPVIVRAMKGSPGRYELVAGERRWRAAQAAGLAAIPAIVRELSDQDSAQWALVENVQREDLNPMERAWAFRSLSEKFGLTQAEIADRVGIDRASVANAVRLTELEPQIRTMIEGGQLSGGHGKALLSAPPGPERVGMAQKASSEHWSVRRLEQECLSATIAAAQGKVKTISLSAREADLRAAVARTALEKQLGEHLGTKVRITTNRAGSRGRLTIEFYGLDHFDGLLAKVGFQMK